MKRPCIIPVRDCLFCHLYLPPRWTNPSLTLTSHHTHLSRVHFLVFLGLMMPILYVWEIYLFILLVPLFLLLFCFMETRCFPCTVKKALNYHLSSRLHAGSWRVSDSPSIHPSVHPSPSICLLGWISVELQYFLIVGNFCTVY